MLSFKPYGTIVLSPIYWKCKGIMTLSFEGLLYVAVDNKWTSYFEK